MAVTSAGIGSPVTGIPGNPNIRKYLERMLTHPPAGMPPRRIRLLRYLVDQALAGRDVTEYGIGVDVFEKPASFDPRIESTVRAEMSRLRRGLGEYYAKGGSGDPWRIDFPNRDYTPRLVPNAAPADAPRSSARTTKVLALAAVALLAAITAIAAWRTARPAPPIRTVAVLRFANSSGDPQADVIARQLTASLERIPGLRVVLADGHNADAIVEGSIRRTNTGLRLTVQVQRVRDRKVLLSRSIDGSGADLARGAGDLSASLAAALRR